MASDTPTVADQEAEEGSLLRYVRALLTFRRNTPELQADAPFEAVWMGQDGYPFVYRRGGLMLALNAAADAREIPFPVGDRCSWPERFHPRMRERAWTVRAL